jgi:hypothetical protein
MVFDPFAGDDHLGAWLYEQEDDPQADSEQKEPDRDSLPRPLDDLSVLEDEESEAEAD